MGNVNGQASETVPRAKGAGYPPSHRASDCHPLYDVYAGGQEYYSCGPRGQCAGIIGSPVNLSCESTYHQDTAYLATQDPPFMYEGRDFANFRATSNQSMVPGRCGHLAEPNQRLCSYCV